MRNYVLITAISLSLAGCSAFSGKKPEKAEAKDPVKEITHVDLNCTPKSGGAPTYADVNRVSIDLVNNRIDLFSKNQIWQFHGVNDKSSGETRDIQIAYIGRNIAAWGVKGSTPFNFFYDTSKAAVTLAYITGGTTASVVFDCL